MYDSFRNQINLLTNIRKLFLQTKCFELHLFVDITLCQKTPNLTHSGRTLPFGYISSKYLKNFLEKMTYNSFNNSIINVRHFSTNS